MMVFFPSRTQKIDDRVYIIRNFIVCLFAYRKSGETILVDTGAMPGAVKKALRKFSIDPLEVGHIFLTHTDSDHAGGLGLFPNAMVYLSRDEEQMINGKTGRFGEKRNNPINREYKLLDDGEKVLTGGTEITCITTPGHTPGSMSYLFDGTYLFSGDTMALFRGRASTSPKFINMDTETEKNSIRKLAGLKNVKMLFTAHSGHSGDFDKAMENWRQSE